MYLHEALHDGAPWFMLFVLTQLVALVQSQTVRWSGIARHPYSKPHDGGALASDLPPESIGRPEVEPLILPRSTHPKEPTSRPLGPAGALAPAPGAAS